MTSDALFILQAGAMKAIDLRLKGKDGSRVQEEGPVSASKALEDLSVRGLDRVLAVRVDDSLYDLEHEINSDTEIEPIRVDSEEGIDILRHSTSHVMAMAVKELFPGVKVTIGPSIENGFYYDFDYERPFKDEDLPRIQEKMEEIVEQDLPFHREVLSRQDAIERFQKEGEQYKVELLEEMEGDTVSLYTQGSFTDLCRGPHIPSTGKIKAFKLTKTAGAYWRGDERRPMLSRIYGVAFADKKELKRYLQRLEEAKKRDHVRLGKELGIFSTHEEIGAGMVVWHPNGGMLRHIVEEFELQEHLKRGYQVVRGPEILKTALWEKSGHFDNYRENMYFTEIDEQSYGIKPMNCLSHMLIYKSSLKSYRDLPQRYFEMGVVHRHERSGVLHGLFRVREFTQDDAHILCTPAQLNSEIKGVIDFVKFMATVFGFDYDLEISTRPEKSIGSDEDWERATSALKLAIEDLGIPYQINEGDGAFYGPKIDGNLRDALDRRWQCSTIQVDFTLPERFDLTYVDKDGEKRRPVMIHRTLLGSMERFIGMLIEQYAGAFPVWLAPVQVVVMTVTDRSIEHGEKVLEVLQQAGIRVEADFRNEKLGLKVREAQLRKVPYMLILGDKEIEGRGVTPRHRSGKNLSLMSPEDFVEFINEETRQRR